MSMRGSFIKAVVLATLGVIPVVAHAATETVDFNWIDANAFQQSAHLVFQIRHNGSDPYNSPNADYLAVGASGTYAGLTVTGIDQGYLGPDNVLYRAGFTDGAGVSWDFTGGAANNYYGTFQTDTLGAYNTVVFNLTTAVAGVPEPATWAMIGIGFAGIGFAARRRTAMVAV